MTLDWPRGAMERIAHRLILTSAEILAKVADADVATLRKALEPAEAGALILDQLEATA